ncbi:MAG: bifunctional phosphopantothenoylcysteine decarboxylase/phosphopantothenate--cysteine ligase CoaBC [Gammaproteobacteria bacterium]|nr:bifunctional phosphopantothenoylcysteine decarboxylase/phosphopantothenate--cysteine ligase CoaBC [Gammaproteobacteria bacterium]
MLSLANKRILLGITGGIAAYKCGELTRLLCKAGSEVRVVMTEAATEFITPLTMQALSGNRVHLDLLDTAAEAAMGHIELARWADLILIAPASADFIARMSHGQANDLLSTLLLAASAPIAIAPAMNQAMWANDGTQNNLQLLRERGIDLWGPDSGEQACGDMGPGRMLEPQALLARCADMFEAGDLAGRKLVITGGPTREALDPVRYLSNHSSGKMAYALATEAVNAGAEVILISGPVDLTTPEAVRRVDVNSALEMHANVVQEVRDADVFIGVAAVADYRPITAANKKIKKHQQSLTIELVKNPDIISEVARMPQRPLVVGFAAETEDLLKNGRHKLESKKLDLLFANHAISTFNSDCIAFTAISRNGEQEFVRGSKQAAARDMLLLVSDALNTFQQDNAA